MGSSHSYLQQLENAGVDVSKINMDHVKVMHLDDWCYMNDSAKAMKICTAEQMHPMPMPADDMKMKKVVLTHFCSDEWNDCSDGGDASTADKMKMKMDHLPHTMMHADKMMTVKAMPLQELNWFSNEAHKLGHDISHEFHKIDWKDVGIDTWHGITACYSNEKCKAAVEKYGAKAVEDAAKLAGKSALMELNGFTNWVHGVEHKVSNDFHKIQWKHLGLDAWHGIEWCYQTAACKDAVEKFGEKAVEDAAEAAALMELHENGFKKFFTGGDNKAIKGFFQGKDDAKIDAGIKRLALGAWHGVEHCYATPKCRAAVEKYGLDAVKIALTVALAPVGALQNLCDGSDCNKMPQFQQQQLMNLCDGSDCNQMHLMML